MYYVYYMMPDYKEVGDNAFNAIYFEDLGKALEHCEEARKMGCRFVCIATEDINNVGKMGVAPPSPDYCWPKRRLYERNI